MKFPEYTEWQEYHWSELRGDPRLALNQNDGAGPIWGFNIPWAGEFTPTHGGKFLFRAYQE